MFGRTQGLSENLAGIEATGRPANVTVQDGLYLGRDGFRANNGDPLPGQFEGPRGISMNLANKVDIVEFGPVRAVFQLITAAPVAVPVNDWRALGALGLLLAVVSGWHLRSRRR